MVSLLLPPQSGSIPIASFCVEQGRWSARGREDVKSFSTAAAAVPSREMKIAMKAPLPTPPTAAEPNPTQAPVDSALIDSRLRHARIPSPGTAYAVAGAAETSQRQQQVWENVRRTQAALAERVGAIGIEPATRPREREARRRAEGLRQGAQSRGRERRRHHRLCVRHQRRAQQRRCLYLERSVPENVGQAVECERDRGDRPPQ